jgi:hypothetical protein
LTHSRIGYARSVRRTELDALVHTARP